MNMKDSPMYFPSMVYTVFTAVTFLVSVELVLTAYGTPLLPTFFAGLASAATSIGWEMDGVGNFLSQLVLLLQLICLVPFFICRHINNDLITPQRQYGSIDEFHEFIRENMLIYCIGNLLLLLSFLAHIVEAIPRGDDGELFLVCVFIGLPGLAFTVLVLSQAVSVIFYGEPNKHSYCLNCDCGSKKQFAITDSQHLYDRVEYETTTTRKGDKVVDVKTRQTKRDKVYSNTYSCINCGSSFKKVESR